MATAIVASVGNESISASSSIDSEQFDSSSVDSKLNSFEEKIIISVFLTVIVLGFFGNILVVWTVLVNKHMRTTSNLFILNLAISDLTLCIFSIPFNVYKVLRHTWIFGGFLCKFAPFFQATNVFVSTMSITAIALDRYVSIVCAMKIRQKGNIFASYGPIICIIFIWTFAFLLSSPLFFFNIYKQLSLNFDLSSSSSDIILIPDDLNGSPISQSQPPQFQLTTTTLSISNSLDYSSESKQANMNNQNETESIDDLLTHINVAHCIENSPFKQSRLIYSYSSLVIQYILPIFIVGIAYGSIWWKLKKQRDKLKSHNQFKPTSSVRNREGGGGADQQNQNEVNNKNNNNTNNEELMQRKNTAKKSRQLKMNILLAFIAIIFAASWLPLNIFNILSDYNVGLMRVGHSYFLINAICILFAMSSAVSNPFLYGFLNENFKREYVALFQKCFTKFKQHPNSIPHNERRNITKTVKTQLETKELDYLTSSKAGAIYKKPETEQLLVSSAIPVEINNNNVNKNYLEQN